MPVNPSCWAGLIDNGDGNLEISGNYANQPWAVSMHIGDATVGKGIAKLWARRKIASLEASRSYGGDLDKVDREIETTALNHHLVSRLTSLVAG